MSVLIYLYLKDAGFVGVVVVQSKYRLEVPSTEGDDCRCKVRRDLVRVDEWWEVDGTLERRRKVDEKGTEVKELWVRSNW